MIIEAVECHFCKKLHKADSETFLSIRGGLHVGLTGGILGGSDIENTTVFCKPCFMKFITEETIK